MAQWVLYDNDKVVIEYTDNEARTKFTMPPGRTWGFVKTEVVDDKQNRKHTYDPATQACTDVHVDITTGIEDGYKEDVTAENVGTFPDPLAE